MTFDFRPDISYLAAAVCVIVYAYQRFNTPALLRYTTTPGQYWMALAGYVTATAGLFAAVTWGLRVNPQIRELFALMAPGAVPPEFATLPAPFVAALLMTIILPKFPGLNRLDASIQSFFRTLGAIPHQALHLSWKMQRAPLHVASDRRGEVVRRLADRGLDPRIFLDAPQNSTEANWAKIVALKVSIEEYSGAHPGFKLLQQEEIDRVEERYARQADMASVVYASGRKDATLKRAFRSDCRALLKEMSEIIARGMFHTQRNLRSVVAELTDWGFEEFDQDIERLSLNQIAGIVLGIAGYLLVFFVIFGTGSAQSVPHMLKMAITIAVIMGAAVACATLPRSVYCRHTRRRREGQRQFLFYVCASLGAAGLWFLIHAARLGLEGIDDLAGIPSKVWQNRPWVLMPVTTAFVTVWLTDNVPGRGRVRERYQSWLEGAVMAIALAVTMLLVQRWLADENSGALDVVQIVAPTLGAAGIGFLIGFFVPALYRKIPEDARRLREEEEAMREDRYVEPDFADPRQPTAARRLARIFPGRAWSDGLTMSQLTTGALGILFSAWEMGRHFAGKARDAAPIS